jgi:hypothetical protein
MLLPVELLPRALARCRAVAAVGVCAAENVILLNSQRSLSKIRLISSCPWIDTSSNKPAHAPNSTQQSQRALGGRDEAQQSDVLHPLYPQASDASCCAQ